MTKLASYNGKVDSIENIKVSPMSRAFLFSDSVYEVISFYKNDFIDFLCLKIQEPIVLF